MEISIGKSDDDETIKQSKTRLWKWSRKIALANNVYCYFMISVIIVSCSLQLIEGNRCEENEKNKDYHTQRLCEIIRPNLNSHSRKCLFWVQRVLWFYMFVAMVYANHKLSSTEKDDLRLIRNWLQVTAIFLVMYGILHVLYEGFCYLLYGGTICIFLFGIIVTAIGVVEFIVIRKFFIEEFSAKFDGMQSKDQNQIEQFTNDVL